MAYTDDWESLMNGVFGPGGRFKAAPGTSAPKTGSNAALPDLNAALLEQQKRLDELLKQQNAQLKTQSDATAAALESSRQMLRDMEDEGLLARGTTDMKPEHLGSFEGLAAEVKQTVLGQDAFVDSVVRAMRRPFVLGTEAPAARNVILLTGGAGTGRHFALEETARCMAARGLLQSDRIATLDLALYPNSGAEKLFLQDLYAALHAPGEILAFEHYESCYPGFLKTLSDLAVKGSAPLSSRYLVNKEGILVDAGTALAPGAVSRIDPCGKYLIFYSHKGREALADKFGAALVSALGDVCETASYTREDLAALAAQQLNALAQKIRTRLGLTLSAGADVRDYVAAQCTAQKGAAGLSACTDRIFRALSEYCLRTDETLTGTVTLTAGPEGVQFRLNDGADQPLFDLLPAAYTGALDAIRAEINELVGLAPVKEYVFGLADNLQVQQRRAAAGLKTASLSMHMIFTGNPGTGKTTIARLVAKYLKAIGALKGGQLVEVTRADLVGRYTGHTAPLTNSVIESALGGVLFIDEAYSLYRGEQDSFGLEAIDTLVKGMEDHRNELVVILAGYTREMETFLTANSGLASRFPNRIEFPDYTAVELLQITQVLAKNKGYTLAEACTEPLLGYYARWQAADARTAGNGRLARNTLEKAIFHQSRRLVAEPAAALDLILPSDLELKEPEE
ncbi:AAA family ATPase [Faecalibacterium sp. Marseille-Q0746]|uniref:AAA family ATPase n=1 Tax=Faecalibacterium sp. Marseille-Q0746 TaxID=2817019 RepID=UPI001A9BA604|nr:AAA family ATPase [Faecalibacterium sp. Marseille-Q0746]MBO1343889.1 AAA family ATPase [Faecalibacterium sp. Marseille-Q0746]